jgi:hypothetical protein
MIRQWLWSLFAALIASAPAAAQTEAWQFRWQAGQVLIYRVEHLTTASELTAGGTTETSTRLNLTKRWQVLDVDKTGTATLRLSLDALRLETRAQNRDPLVFDSEHLDKSDPHLQEQLVRFLGQPLAVLRVNRQGKVVEVKESKHGPASRFESEPPFVILLPAAAVKPGQSWERAYQITLEPPQGTGEKYEALQKYVCKAVATDTATIALATFAKTMPDNMLDRVPLLQMQPEGEVLFNLKEGRLRRAHLHIEKELKGHQGEGSSCRFRSTYTEEFVDIKG